MKLNKKIMAIVFFILAYFSFVFSNSFYVHENIKVFYYLKHFSVFFAGLFGVVFFDKYLKKTYFSLFFILFPVFLPYLFQGFSGKIVFFQYILFILSAIVISKLWETHITFKSILIFFAFSMIPLVLDIFLNNSSFIYNDFYGRGRLLLGYFHPKEAAVSLFVFFVMFRIFLPNKSRRIVPFYDLIVILVLFFVSSRNILIFYLNFIFSSFFIRNLGAKTFAVLFILIVVFITVFGLAFFYEEINLFMSNRLSVWTSGDYRLFGVGTTIPDGGTAGGMSKFHIDNFYLEYLIENGVVSLFYLIFSLLYIYSLLGNYKHQGVSSGALFFSFLVSCFFDAGMFSSGNILNLFIWSFVVSSLYCKNREKYGVYN